MIVNDEARLIPWDDRYAVSREGQLFSKASFNRWHSRNTEWKQIHPCPNAHGYLITRIKSKEYKVHHLVAALFIGPLQKGLFVRHMNDNKTDNRVINLAYGTCQQNADDAVRNGRSIRGSRHPKTNFSEWNILQIRDMCASGYQQKHIAKKFNCSTDTISSIFCGRTWGWLDQKNTRTKRLNSRCRQPRAADPPAFPP